MNGLHRRIFRDIAIQEHEVPGARFSWTNEATGAVGIARTIEEAMRQISSHLGADPDCARCNGHGSEDWTLLAIVPCAACFPEDKS